jgi:hypothetical protein
MRMECGEIQAGISRYWLGDGDNSTFFIVVLEEGDTKKDVI